VACDSLYVAWLKAHYPYELYATMLDIFDKKKNKDKIANIISEMKRYKGIDITPGCFGQDNRDWLIDKGNKLISQSLSSIRYMQKTTAEELFELSRQDTACMGTYFTKDVFTPEIKPVITKLKRQLKPLQKQGEEMFNSGVDIFSEEFLAVYDKGYALEQEIKRLEADNNSYMERAREVKVTAKLDCFTNVLRAIHIGTGVKQNQIEILIGLNYFSRFGKTGKLMKVYREYFEGPNNLKNKSLASFQERLETLRKFEASLPDTDLPSGLRLKTEYDNIGLCLSTDPSAPNHAYFVQSVDDKYGVKAKLYNIRRGTTGIIRIARQNYLPIAEGSCINIENYRVSPKYAFRNGQKTVIPGEKEIWVTEYSVMQKGEAGVS